MLSSDHLVFKKKKKEKRGVQPGASYAEILLILIVQDDVELV